MSCWLRRVVRDALLIILLVTARHEQISPLADSIRGSHNDFLIGAGTRVYGNTIGVHIVALAHEWHVACGTLAR